MAKKETNEEMQLAQEGKLKALQAGNITVFCGFHYPDTAAVFCGCRGRLGRGNG